MLDTEKLYTTIICFVQSDSIAVSYFADFNFRYVRKGPHEALGGKVIFLLQGLQSVFSVFYTKICSIMLHFAFKISKNTGILGGIALVEHGMLCPDWQLTAFWRQSTLSTIREQILITTHAPLVALHVAHKVASNVVSCDTTPWAVFPVEILRAAKLEPDSDVRASIPNVLVQGFEVGRGAVHRIGRNGHRETCHQAVLCAHSLLHPSDTLLPVVDSHMKVHLAL